MAGHNVVQVGRDAEGDRQPLGLLDDLHDLFVRIGLQGNEHGLNALGCEDGSQITYFAEHGQAVNGPVIFLAVRPHKAHDLIPLRRRRAQRAQQPEAARLHAHDGRAPQTNAAQQELPLKTAHQHPPTCHQRNHAEPVEQDQQSREADVAVKGGDHGQQDTQGDDLDDLVYFVEARARQRGLVEAKEQEQQQPAAAYQRQYVRVIAQRIPESRPVHRVWIEPLVIVADDLQPAAGQLHRQKEHRCQTDGGSVAQQQ